MHARTPPAPNAKLLLSHPSYPIDYCYYYIRIDLRSIAVPALPIRRADAACCIGFCTARKSGIARIIVSFSRACTTHLLSTKATASSSSSMYARVARASDVRAGNVTRFRAARGKRGTRESVTRERERERQRERE